MARLSLGSLHFNLQGRNQGAAVHTHTGAPASPLPHPYLAPALPLPCPCLASATPLPRPCLAPVLPPASPLPRPCLTPASPLPQPCHAPPKPADSVVAVGGLYWKDRVGWREEEVPLAFQIQ